MNLCTLLKEMEIKGQEGVKTSVVLTVSHIPSGQQSRKHTTQEDFPLWPDPRLTTLSTRLQRCPSCLSRSQVIL